jgi:hypothetical protein
MTGDIEFCEAKKILSAVALVHAVRTACKPVRDVCRQGNFQPEAKLHE